MKGGYGEVPGRLDFLGGVSDYSGSLVLQTPLSATTRVTIAEIDEPLLRVKSTRESTVDWSLEAVS